MMRHHHVQLPFCAAALFTVALVALAGCSHRNPADYGQIGVEIHAPSTIYAYAPFSSHTTDTSSSESTAETEPCDTLVALEVDLTHNDTAETAGPFVYDIAEAQAIEIPDIPAGDWATRVQIRSATERILYAATVTITVLPQQQTRKSITLEETGRCPFPDPGPPTLYSLPNATGCENFTFAGTKPLGTHVISLALPDSGSENSFGDPFETTWRTDGGISILSDSLAQGIQFITVWFDVETVQTSVDSPDGLSTMQYEGGDLDLPKSLMCFDPYSDQGHFSVDGADYTLAWDNGTSSMFDGVFWVEVDAAIETAVTSGPVTDLTVDAPAVEIFNSSDGESFSGTVSDATVDRRLLGYTVIQLTENTYRHLQTGNILVPASQ